MAGGADDLDRLRREAELELEVLIERRSRRGEDPWVFMPELPTVDEQVVLRLRAEALEDARLEPHRARAVHPSIGREGSGRHEFVMLRSIALRFPELTRAVWSLIHRLGA